MIPKQFLREPFLYRANTSDVVLSTDIYDPKRGKHINYKFNNYGFRCDNFDDWKIHSHRVVFLGCSYTEGIGLELDDTWPKIIHKMICDKGNIRMPFWNLSAAASGTDHLTRYLYHYINILNPQLIICYLPTLERRERWVGDYFKANSLVDVYGRSTLNKIFLEEMFVEYQTEKNFAMMDLLLESSNSFMLVHHANQDLKINFKNIKLVDFNADVMYYDTKIDIARDGLHPGPNSNKIFAERFFNCIEQDCKEKLNVSWI